MSKFCIIIPVFNHAAALQRNIGEILSQQVPLIIIDDGNDSANSNILQKIVQHSPQIQLLKLTPNQGKGAAMSVGFLHAVNQGFSHALQIDADGQHKISDIPLFIELSKQNPEAVINGCPSYDDSVPKARLYGRKITNFWVAVETLSGDIKDAMCGFRIYPLDQITKILQHRNISKRMGFDTEIIVLLHWQGVKIINQSTQVIYPVNNSSNFRAWRDNLQISLLHIKLCLEAIKRIFIKS